MWLTHIVTLGALIFSMSKLKRLNAGLRLIDRKSLLGHWLEFESTFYEVNYTISQYTIPITLCGQKPICVEYIAHNLQAA